MAFCGNFPYCVSIVWSETLLWIEKAIDKEQQKQISKKEKLFNRVVKWKKMLLEWWDLRARNKRSDLWWIARFKTLDSTIHLVTCTLAQDIHLTTTLLTGYSYIFHIVFLLFFLSFGKQIHLSSLKHLVSSMILQWIHHLSIVLITYLCKSHILIFLYYCVC